MAVSSPLNTGVTKIEVHGLGTRKTGNEQTIQHSVVYNKDICVSERMKTGQG